jgi:hypothetical protein
MQPFRNQGRPAFQPESIQWRPIWPPLAAKSQQNPLVLLAIY